MGNKKKQFGSNQSNKNKRKLVNARLVKRQKITHNESLEDCNKPDYQFNNATPNCLSIQTASYTSDYNNDHFESKENSNMDSSRSNDIFDSFVENLLKNKSNEEKTNSTELFETSMECNVPNSSPFEVESRRIIDFPYFFDQIKSLSNHNPGLGCTIGNMQILSEKLFGLESITFLKCNMCNSKFDLQSSKKIPKDMTLNHAAVTGTMLIGCGRTNLNELLTAMNLPNISQKIYSQCHNDVSEWWATAAEKTMTEAAKEEAELASESGDVIDGVPAITVVADACWSKRSYRTNYSAASGAAAVIGLKSGKVLHMQVKNKYCFVCTRSLLKKQPPPKHQCTKNHVGSSTSMEQASIVEGFKSSVEKRNLIYATLIADGDASTYKKILESRPYSNVQVQKIECTNHLLRNYCSKLMQLQKDTSIPLLERKLLTAERITRLRTAVRAAARFRKAQNTNISQKVINIKDDIINSPMHIFGDHSFCQNYYCKDDRKTEQNLVPLVKTLLKKIMTHTTQIALHSKSLLWDVNNNRAEQFNSIVAKHVGGKRINFSLKNSYTARCHAAVVAFNTGKAQCNLYKSNFNRSPHKSIQLLESRRFQRNLNRRPTLKRKLIYRNENIDYGEKCQKADMTPEQYGMAKSLYETNLKAQLEKRHEVERDTILQAESALWLELRRSLLTASLFSKICKRRPNISSAPLVKSLVYSYSLASVPAIEYGKNNEKTALEQLEQQEGVVVQKCGLFIDHKYYFLGASPDGLYEEGIIEIKCPYSARNMNAEEAISKRKITFWKPDGTINTNHNWYYQIQGQLHISAKQTCLFAVWTGEEFPLKTIKITRDDKFWSKKMETRLISFYEKCFLPEQIDPRKNRSMPIRDTSF